MNYLHSCSRSKIHKKKNVLLCTYANKKHHNCMYLKMDLISKGSSNLPRFSRLYFFSFYFGKLYNEFAKTIYSNYSIPSIGSSGVNGD